MKDFINEWSKVVSEAKVMLEEKNFEAYTSLMESANSIYESYKKDDSLRYRNTNFGASNHIFEDALPKLFKTNKKAVKEFVTTIKEDKNLMMEFNFYKALERYNTNLDAKDYVNESIALAMDKIDTRTLGESNMKLSRLIEKYDIKPSSMISEEKMKLYSDCDYILSHKKSLGNLNEHNEKVNSIIAYTKANYNSINESKVNLSSIVENFNKKYSTLLNEEEKSLVKDIMDFKNPQNEEKKSRLFNKFKNECLENIDKLLESASEDDKIGLNALKEEIGGKVFCSETLVNDLAKLLEIRDVLMSE